ncbi:glycosyltransferase [Trinickia sp. EG282A]|uniref:glycosyltransferase family 2 protein n=1 Tax=Trinickia sp. EG282A TaxID=3237013 RepID=UPI0034D2AE70
MDAPSQEPNEELERAQERIAALEDELANARRIVEQASTLKRQNDHLLHELESLRNSTCWRVTAPLRAVAGRAQKASHLAARIAGAVDRGVRTRGGVRGLVRHFVAIVRSEGMSGIKGRLLRADGLPSVKQYQNWIEQYDSLDDGKRAEIRQQIAAFARKPLISIVVPTYNSDERLLREMIASVRAQLYTNWELCIADDASPDPRVAEVLAEAAAADPRIRFVVRTTNGHISEASNTALELARGEYVALLDHDDVLPEHALFVVAAYINRHPRGRLFYSDEDKITLDGQRTDPYFKPDWNPLLSLSQNMFSHLGVFDTALLRQVGGFRKGFEGSQDHDLIFRCVEIASDQSVVHIPHVLYHWRIMAGSTAQSGSEKPYARQARLRAVQEHLSRTGVRATAEDDSGHLRVRFAVPAPAPEVSIIIPTRDRVELLRQCIESVRSKSTYPNYEIIVVDNGSTEQPTLDYFSAVADEGVRILRDDSPFNFSVLNNRAVEHAAGEFICLLNNDIEVITPDWLEELVSLASQPGTGAVGARLWYPDEKLQHGGVVLGLGGVAGHIHHGSHRWQTGYFARAISTQNLSAVTAACLVIRKTIYEEVGGLDEELAVAFNDVDFCIKVLRAGYRNAWTPFAELYHHESASRGSDMDPGKYQRFVGEVERMQARWPDLIARDPAYNPNLTLDSTRGSFALSFPPRIGMLE